MDDEKQDLRSYWRIFRRWWWVFILGAVGAGSVSFVLSRGDTPIYEATAKMLVEGRQAPGLPSSSDIAASQQLAGSFSDLILTRPIFKNVGQKLSPPMDFGAVASKVRVKGVRSVIEVTGIDPDPIRAAEVANVTVETFIEDFRDRQFTQIARFQASLSQYGISQDPSIIAAQTAALSTLSILEDALPPGSPRTIGTWRNIILTAVLGLLIAGLLVFFLEHLDSSVKSPDELKALTGLVTLGLVPRYTPRDGLSAIILGAGHQRSSMAEAYNFLRTNLEFAALGTGGLRSLVITSSSPVEGKTTTAANLAITVAREGKSVILVDTDLRRPGLHRIFPRGDHKGLTQVVLGTATLEDALAPTAVPGLQVLLSGPLPPDPTPVLKAPRMKELVEQLEARADLVLFDSPPLLVVTDPMLIASLADGVLLVMDAHRTGREAVKRSAESLRQANLPVLGAVLNKVGPQSGGYYYYYYYHRYHYYSDDGNGNGMKSWLQNGPLVLLGKLFGKEEKDRERAGKP